MFKKSIVIITSFVLFAACKKDPQINPPPVAQPVVVTPPPPIKIIDNVFPDPFQSIFTIEANTTDSQTVVMYDMLGRLKLSLTINGTTVVHNSLPNGVYVLEITNRTGSIKKKMIKQ